MEGIYKVNLIPSDLSSEETILQIADTLDNLNGIVENVFSRILTRIKQNTDKTNNLKERIEVSRSKVDKLTGMQKAIKVFSSAKYPASITHEHYRSVFDLHGYKHEPSKITLSGKAQGLSNEKAIQEKLHFYHVKVADRISPKAGNEFDLNAVIDNLESVGELLVFNTDESPYLGTVTKTAAYVPAIRSKAVSKSLLEDAPSSIVNRDVLKREADEYMYAPGMGMVPELEVPLDLPNLANVAGDIQFYLAGDGSIAPSVVTSPMAVTMLEAELPDLAELKVPEVSELKVAGAPAQVPDMPDAPPPPPLVPVDVQALPPPPPPVPVDVQALPPPPPPPPPMMPPPPPIEPQRQEKPSQAGAPPPAGDAHANLMDAIRKAGGAGRAKLRSSAAADNKPTKAATGGGDLMADLHAKLSMRRRGISGAERGAGVLATLAAVIPEPVESSPPRSDTDEDWE